MHQVRFTAENWDPEGLGFAWPRPVFSEDDGLGSLESLHQVGDSVCVIGSFTDERMRAAGSGVMVAPGLLLTATHVMRDPAEAKRPPVICTFLPDGAARAWLPYETNTLTGPGRFAPFGVPETPIVSDLTLVSCVLMSDAQAPSPMMMAPLEITLPLPGERLWAVGFREGDLDEEATGISPLLASGLVTECYLDGRGTHQPSPCVEVAMNTVGGMSGGPVFNAAGRVVGVVSSSFESPDGLGPTYVTLAWDALRVGVQAPWPRGRWPKGDVDLLQARELGLARIHGAVERRANGDVSLGVDGAIGEFLAAFQISRGEA